MRGPSTLDNVAFAACYGALWSAVVFPIVIGARRLILRRFW